MRSSDDYESAFIEKLFDINFSNVAKRQLDVILVNTTEHIINCDLDNSLSSK